MAIRQTPLEDQRTGNYRSSQSPVRTSPPAWLSKPVKKDKGEEDNFNTNNNNPFAGAKIGSGATENASRFNQRPVSREYSRGPAYGGRYNPSTGQQTQIPLTRAPAYNGGYNPTATNKPKWMVGRSAAYGGKYDPTKNNPASAKFSTATSYMNPNEQAAAIQRAQNPNSFMGQNDPHHLFNPYIDRYQMTGPNTPWWPTGAQAPVNIPTPTAQPAAGGYPYSFSSRYGGNWGRGGYGGGGGYSYNSSPAWSDYYLKLNSWNI